MPQVLETIARRHIPALDGVRAIAIVAVLVAHSVPGILSDIGTFGVDLFFVLSGFLITGILLDSRERAGYFTNFYARRMLRLFPLYYTYLLLLMTVVPILHRVAHSSMSDYSGNWWWYLTYFCNWKANQAANDPYLGHFWSLAVEEQFYLVWPAVVYFLPRRYVALACAALIISAGLLRGLWSYEGKDWNMLYRLTVTRWDTLGFGALAALAMRSPAWRPWALKGKWIAVAGLGAWLAVALSQRSFDWTNPHMQTYGVTLAAIGFTGVVLYAATTESQWLRQPLMLSLGKYSYAIYVLHLLIATHVGWVGAYLEKKWHLPPISTRAAVFLASNVITYVAAALSWRYLEAPVLKLKDRFT